MQGTLLLFLQEEARCTTILECLLKHEQLLCKLRSRRRTAQEMRVLCLVLLLGCTAYAVAQVSEQPATIKTRLV
jgi:hypothetical protein